jgi:hypothetical protein
MRCSEMGSAFFMGRRLMLPLLASAGSPTRKVIIKIETTKYFMLKK